VDWETLAAFIAAAAGVAAVVLSGLVYSRQFPKRSLEYDVTIAPLVSLHNDELRITYGAAVLREPYIATVSVTSRSRVDIVSSVFDAGNALTFDFESPIVGIAELKGSLSAEASGNQFRIPPQLIHKRDKVTANLIFDGEPAIPRLKNPLPDIDLYSREVADARRRRASRIERVITIVGFSIVVLVVAGLLIDNFIGWPWQTVAQVDASQNPTVSPGGAEVRSKPNVHSQLVAKVPSGAKIGLVCAVFGSSLQGTDGTTWLWYQVKGGGFVSDTQVFTGTTRAVRHPCADQ
jgi:hypothetical protein